MTLDKNADHAYIWIWLPNATQPVVAGLITQENDYYVVTYGKKYRTESNAIRLSPYELPLIAGTQQPSGLSPLFSCLRDAAPDAWGRRLIDYQYPKLNPNELDYLLLSGSNRIGALDFQTSADHYVARDGKPTTIEEIILLADIAENKKPITKKLLPLLYHGTSIGGARPKCIITKNNKEYIAKFSLSSDYYPIVKAEYLAMTLAKKVGLAVAEVELYHVANRDVLLVKRFDRTGQNNLERKLLLSGLSLLGLDEMEARYASYIDFADLIRKDFSQPDFCLKELYGRLIFNVLIGNTDDHARNHAAFWNGQQLTLTPAYDICPQLRVGHEATQAMRIDGEEGQHSTLTNVLSISKHFLLSTNEAKKMINTQIKIIRKEWESVVKKSSLSKNDETNLLGSTILSEYCLLRW